MNSLLTGRAAPFPPTSVRHLIVMH